MAKGLASMAFESALKAYRLGVLPAGRGCLRRFRARRFHCVNWMDRSLELSLRILQLHDGVREQDNEWHRDDVSTNHGMSTEEVVEQQPRADHTMQDVVHLKSI